MHALVQVQSSADPELKPVAGAPPAREWVFIGREECEAGLQKHVLPIHCIPMDAHSYRCRAIVVPLCDALVAELQIDASSWLRRQEELAKGGEDRVQVLWQQAGWSRVRQGRQGSTIETGALTFFHAGRECAIEFGPHARCLLLLVPRSQCMSWLSAMDHLAALPLLENGPGPNRRVDPLQRAA